MSRLYDCLIISPLEKEWIDKLKTAIVIDANNVCEYYFSGTEQEEWDMLKDFPNLAPPFKNFFIEMKSPKFIKSEKYGIINTTQNETRRWGIHFLIRDMNDKFPMWEREAYFIWSAIKQKLFPMNQEEDIRWIIFSYLYTELRNKETHGPLACFLYFINKSGGVISLKNEGGYICVLFGRYREKNLKAINMGFDKLIERGLATNFFPAYLAVSFMHCKNVTTEEIIPPEKLSKKFRKKHGRELIRYHILKIEPMRKILKTAGKSDKLGIPKALHICRGHFKDYRQSGLFGKIPGIFWWESHIRGQKEEGIILKDYEIGKPKLS